MKYDVTKNGIIVAAHIFLKNGYQPMATLVFAFGGHVTIEWDNIKEREKYKEGINAYTVFFDDRTSYNSFEKILNKDDARTVKYIPPFTKD